jgi:hypothetical protein
MEERERMSMGERILEVVAEIFVWAIDTVERMYRIMKGRR